MRCAHRTRLIEFAALLAGLTISGCERSRWVAVPAVDGAVKSTATVRAERRLYDGAPPVIPHVSQGAACGSCHNDRGMAVEALGFAPPSPHLGTSTEHLTIRCRQCHVFGTSRDVFVANDFVGLPQNLRPGGRLSPISPPTIPHGVFMRENCLACHAGPAAREEMRTTHPERTRCRQCHVPESSRSSFDSALGAGLTREDSSRSDVENN